MKSFAAATVICAGLATMSPGPTHAEPETLAKMSWLAGEWQGAGLGGESEIYFSPVRAGAIVGLFRQYQDGKPLFYEIVKIFEVDGGTVLRLKHFNPPLTGWEEKDEWVEFPLIEVTDREIRFDGVRYVRDGDGQFSAYVDILHAGESEPKTERFIFRRKGRLGD